MLEDEPEKIPDTADLLLQLREQLDAARSMPLSASVMLNRDEFGEILQDAIDGLPEELRQARWLLQERDEVLERAEHEAERIIDVARVRAERMVERTEVVRGAPRRRGHDRPGRAPRRQDAARGRGLRRPQARQLRGRARPHDAAGRQGPRAPVGARPDPRGPPRARGRGSRAGLLRPGDLMADEGCGLAFCPIWVWALTEKCSDLLGSGLCRGAAG